MARIARTTSITGIACTVIGMSVRCQLRGRSSLSGSLRLTGLGSSAASLALESGLRCVLAPDRKLRLVIFEEPDLLLDPQLFGEPVGDQVIDDFQRCGQEIGARIGGLGSGCGR